MESKRATKETGTCISCIANATKANTHGIPIISLVSFVRRLAHAGWPVSSPCLLRQVSSVWSRNREGSFGPLLMGAQVVTADFVAGELHGLSMRTAAT